MLALLSLRYTLVACLAGAQLLVCFVAAHDEAVELPAHGNCLGGVPEGTLEAVHHRNGYSIEYDSDFRIPRWVGYRVTPDYLIGPDRKGDWTYFRPDPDIDSEPLDNDYDGVFSAQGYARGHLYRYFASGGDRDGDGQYASTGFGSSSEHRAVADSDDAQTVYETNYMSNIAPQTHHGFNGIGGAWYDVETLVRETLVEKMGLEVWVFAGCIVNDYGTERVVTSDGLGSIRVPHAFWKILIFQHDDQWTGLAFLFPHNKRTSEGLEDLLVSVDIIEALSNLDFFAHNPFAESEEAKSTFKNWVALRNDLIAADFRP